jgi:hypothetical protein
MTNLTNSINYARTPRGSVEFEVKLILNPSGMAHLVTDSGPWPMGTDQQMIGNLLEAVRVGRSKV